MAYEKVWSKGVEWVGGRHGWFMLGSKTCERVDEGDRKIIIGTHLEEWWKGGNYGGYVVESLDFGI